MKEDHISYGSSHLMELAASFDYGVIEIETLVQWLAAGDHVGGHSFGVVVLGR